MKLIQTEEAAGHILCQDITQIIKDVSKGPVFRKGHVVREEDIPVLLSVGKEHLYVWEDSEGMLHEDEGARRLYALCANTSIVPSGDIREGKIEAFADCDGLFSVDTERLLAINMLGDLMIACRKNETVVHRGDKLAGMRVIPLAIEEEKLKEAEKIQDGRPLLILHPFPKRKAGIITTGSEVYKGRIQDAFGPVVMEKLREYDAAILGQILVDDNAEMIEKAIREMIGKGAELVICTGGMSVDPDDVTPGGIRRTGADIITYGAPVLPGAMLLVSYYENKIPVIGLPGCVMYAGRTVFDKILPKLIAGVRVTKEELASYGNGGLCLNCEVCHFPNCGFGGR